MDTKHKTVAEVMSTIRQSIQMDRDLQAMTKHSQSTSIIYMMSQGSLGALQACLVWLSDLEEAKPCA